MDTCMEERSVWASLSRGVSYLLHPFLMPVWLLLILFGTGILPIYLPVGIKRYILMVVTVDTLVVPALGILLMRVFGLLGDFSLSRRYERTLLMLIVALCYGLCGWMLGSSPMLFLLRRMMFAAMACTLFALLVNLRWQVSLHMTAAGAATGYGRHPVVCRLYQSRLGILRCGSVFRRVGFGPALSRKTYARSGGRRVCRRLPARRRGTAAGLKAARRGHEGRHKFCVALRVPVRSRGFRPIPHVSLSGGVPNSPVPAALVR